MWLDQTLVALASTSEPATDRDLAGALGELPPINTQALDAGTDAALDDAIPGPRIRPQSWLVLVVLLLLTEPLLRRRGWTE